jgi:pyrophosphate--fructose-6-phosphate 1-phosphotransferase
MVHLEKELEALTKDGDKISKICEKLSKESATVLKSLPIGIQSQLLAERDPHGNVQVSLIETEKLLMEMVGKELKARSNGKLKLKALNHFYGYEGRCAHPSNFDSDYAYSLGYAAAALAQNKLTGYISSVSNLAAHVDEWKAGGVPATMLMNMERRHGKDKPVIQKALVELDGAPFQTFAENRAHWAATESYFYPGTIQFFGPSEICDAVTLTLALEAQDR